MWKFSESCIHAGADGQDADLSVAVEIFTLGADGKVLQWRGLSELTELHSLLRSNMVRCSTAIMRILHCFPFYCNRLPSLQPPYSNALPVAGSREDSIATKTRLTGLQPS